ncbi:MAG: response regulator transcription factor, partial [Ruminococcus sp.]|nr:response regulator transcription factor [Ruminococcus sp.]
MEKLKVLLVDDEPLLLESLEIILTIGGLEVAGTARDGNEALRLLEKVKCDMALVDINMQGMGGIELIGHLKKDYPHIKILVLTT